MIDSIADAIKELATECSYKYDSTNDVLIINSITPSTVKEEDIRKKAKELEDEYTSLKYQRQRASEYPSIPDQLDEIYHNGINAWKAVIKKTKDKCPKG